MRDSMREANYAEGEAKTDDMMQDGWLMSEEMTSNEFGRIEGNDDKQLDATATFECADGTILYRTYYHGDCWVACLDRDFIAKRYQDVDGWPGEYIKAAGKFQRLKGKQNVHD